MLEQQKSPWILEKVDLAEADLSYAYLKGARLKCADLMESKA